MERAAGEPNHRPRIHRIRHAHARIELDRQVVDEALSGRRVLWIVLRDDAVDRAGIGRRDHAAGEARARHNQADVGSRQDFSRQRVLRAALAAGCDGPEEHRRIAAPRRIEALKAEGRCLARHRDGRPPLVHPQAVIDRELPARLPRIHGEPRPRFLPPIVRPPPQRLGIVADVADERVGVRVLRAQRIGRVVGEVELAAECPGARLAEQLVLAHDPGLDRMGTARVREIDARVEGDVVARDRPAAIISDLSGAAVVAAGPVGARHVAELRLRNQPERIVDSCELTERCERGIRRPLNAGQGVVILGRSGFDAVVEPGRELEDGGRVEDARVVELADVGKEVIALAHQPPPRGGAGDVDADALRPPSLILDRQRIVAGRPPVAAEDVLAPRMRDAGLLRHVVVSQDAGPVR